jgi:hypothetical protein
MTLTPQLSPDHLQQLTEGSGIAPDVAQERGCYTITQTTQLKALRFPAYQWRVPGILFPVHTTNGEVLPIVYRPDVPRIVDGQPRKYDQAAHSPVRLDCPPRCRPSLMDPDVPLWITEGAKKGDSLASRGACVLALPGVWGFRVPKRLDPQQPPLPDWKYVQLGGRLVTIVFDSDVSQNQDVAQARARLAHFLTSRGAQVRYCTLPALPTGGKCGVDDYFVMGHSLADLEALTQAPAAAQARPHAVRISARALKAEVLPPLNFVVKEILPAGCTLLTGKSKDGKSMLAYNLTVAVASGGLALGTYPTMAGSVWYLALEDGKRRAQTRLALQEAQMGPLPEEAQDRLAFTLWEAPRLGAGLEEDIRAWIETTPDARLVVIDILEKVRPPRTVNGNTYAEDYAATSSLTRLAEEHNVAILILHHSNKSNPADFRDSASGAMSLVGGADNFWSLSRQPLSEDATLKVTGRDLPHEYDLAMQFKDGYWTALGETRLVVMSSERQVLVDVLQDSGRAMTPTQLARATGKNVNTIKILLRKMLDTGVVIQPTEGHYALSPSYLSTTINSINPINSVNPVNPINPETQPIDKREVKADRAPHPPGEVPDISPGMGEGGFTRVYGGFTVENATQPIEKTELNGGTVYGFTGFTETTPLSNSPLGSSPDCLPPPCAHPETRTERMEDGSTLVRCTACRYRQVTAPERQSGPEHPLHWCGIN